jgi:hypothetical protein
VASAVQKSTRPTAGVSFAGLGLLAIGVGANDPRFGFVGALVASFGLPGRSAFSRKIVR